MSRLEVHGMTKRFGGLVAVRDVDLTVEEASITALIGPNGAGKTTLFNLITGFERADAGTIVFAGERISKPTPARLARRGMLRTFQTPVGFPKLSVWENLMVAGMEPAPERILSGLLGGRLWKPDHVSCDERARELLRDLELEEQRDMVVEDLSAGQTKLLEFGRQLMARPRMLLLDEPAAGIDPAHIDRLADLIRRLRAAGITILIIDHNLSFVLGIAEYVYVLAEGSVISSGEPEQVARDPRVIETYLGEAA